MPNPASPNTNALITQLTTGPSISEVAATALRPALKTLYPQLDIDPDLAVVVSPLWLEVDGEIIPAQPHHESLSSALARHALAGTHALYIDGEHYLTYRSNSRPDIHLPVRIDAISRLINELAPLLFYAYQEQQLAYWNSTNGPTGTRWQALAGALRAIWTQPGSDWDEDEQAMAKLVVQYPDYATRLPHDKYQTHTYLIDLDLAREDSNDHLGLTSLAVLIGTHQEQSMIIVWSLAIGFEKFDTLQDLGQALNRLVDNPHNLALHWRLFEPAGNFFESQACTLVGLQIDAITELGPGLRMEDATAEQEIAPDINELPTANQAELLWLSDALPEWLKKASPGDLSLYSRYLLDLAQLNDRHANKTYQDGITPIEDYAAQVIREQLLKDHPDAANLNLRKVRISVSSQVVLGLFTAPGLVDTVSFNLIELALQNLVALPLGNKTVSYENGASVPTWMTIDYLEQLITQADVGKNYPALIKQTLLDDPTESVRRQTLYTEQLRLQLPLLALQYKIRGQFGLDELGYRYICAVMSTPVEQRRVDGENIVIRPLAFIPSLRRTQRADKVDTMFVIGPQNAQAGPCVLYRPLSDTPLLQFASPTNLLYAIKQNTPLRQAVLAWLPEASRFSYAQFVFPGPLSSPWVLSKLLVEPLSAVVMSGPIALTNETLADDALAALFKANANALVTLADQQSVSNAEGRWESFKHAGWLIFNAALPFLGKTVGTAAWAGQIMDDLEQAIEANEVGDRQAQRSAMTGLFLNLGMALAVHIASRRARRVQTPAQQATQPKVIPTVLQKADIETAQLPAEHESSLHTQGALIRQPLSLGKTLDSFNLQKPAGLGAQTTEPGPYQYLYPLASHWYAPVGERWFQVVVDDNDSVVLVDPQQPTRQGPVLVNNRLGQWFVDTRLRLRAGGLRSRLKKSRQLRPPKIAELRKKLDEFDAQRIANAAELEKVRTATRSATPETAQAERASFTGQLKTCAVGYEVAISHLKSLNLLDSVADYPGRMISYLKQQILLTRAAIDEDLAEFKGLLKAVAAHMKNSSPARPEHQRLYDMTGELLQRLDYLNSRFSELHGLGPEALKLIAETRKRMPSAGVDDLDDFKSLRVSLTRYRTIQGGEEATGSDARRALNSICEAADIAIRSLRDIQSVHDIAPLDERIDALDILVDQFAVITQDALDLPGEFPGQVRPEPLEQMRTQVDEFARRAARELITKVRERKALEPRPEASGSHQSPPRKIIKTRSRDVVVGEPRPKDPTLVDVKDPLTQNIIATFHEKSPGVWVKRVPLAQPVPRAPALGLKASMRNAQALLDDVDHFIERTKGLSGETRRLPVEIEEKVRRQIIKLEEAGNAVEHAANATNETDDTASRGVREQIDEAIKKLHREGERIKTNMLKTLPPTAAHLQLLLIAKEVSVDLLGVRRRLKGPRKDYLQEYEIRDKKTKQVLWYAHFHYASPEAANENYSAAHLKTLEQRRMGGAFETRGDSEQAGVAVYRSEISPYLARLLFLDPRPAVPDATPGPSSATPG